ncbi:MAG: translation initiation factor IF-3 [Lachnospiraceae bacterium]|nr:translation initiation factor IF-3 [Lachnospiraceae bacterium]
MKQSIHSHLSAAERLGFAEGHRPKGHFLKWIVCLSTFFDAAGHKREETAISELQINEQIRDREIRLIGENGEQLGIMSAREALEKAIEAELDLVKIAPMANPPVCKIIDYGKYRYEQLRKEKEAKKKQKTMEVKEIRFSPNIGENDLSTKAAAARKFLERGDKVKVSMRFRGREISHMNQFRYVLEDFAAQLSDIAVVDKPAKVEGRSLVIFLAQKK